MPGSAGEWYFWERKEVWKFFVLLSADSHEMEKELETAGQHYGAHVVWFCT